MGRSLTEDLKTELENQSWTNFGTNPNVKIGERYGRIGGNYGVVVYEEEDDPSDYTTFAGSIAAREQEGIVELWNKNNDDRQSMIEDVETILTGNSATYNWNIMRVERTTLKNNLYNAEIRVRRII